jgi:hypothetical protein
MILGKLNNLLFFLFLFSVISNLNAEEKISVVPLINLDDLKPSYEEEEIDKINIENENSINLKKKNKKITLNNITSINIIGLDKITAKTSKINIKLGEKKIFGVLEIKALKCGKIDSINEPGEAAFIQVTDISENQNEKVFVFNGWTFSSSPTLRPIEHPVYDLWLIGCENV